jgi:predicted TIM-barrel fold metal-dependent hydrolase
MIIDLHTHPFGNPDFNPGDAIQSRRDVVTLRRRRPDVFGSRYVNVQDLTDLLVADMQAGRIDKAFIQPGFAEDPVLVATAVKKHPQHLIGLFNVGHEHARHPAESEILQKIDWTRTGEQIEHYVKDLGLVGCGEVLPTRFTSESAPERIAKELRPLMEILARYRVPVMFLTGWTQFSTPLYHGMPLFADVLAEWFPEVPIIITKMGRGYSFIFEMALAVAYKHPNVYFDIVQAPPEHIERGVRELGADRIMFGTDWSPTWRAEAGDIYKKNLEKVEILEISEEAKDWIRWKTAAKLFRLDIAEGRKEDLEPM